MQKHLKTGRLTAWFLAVALLLGSMPMTAMAAEPGDTVSGKTAVYFVSDSETEGIPFEELVSGMEDYMEDSGTESLFPQEEPYALKYEPDAYASLEELAEEVLGSDESLAYREAETAVIVTGVEEAEQVEKEGICVTEEGDEVSIRINTYQEVGISQKEGQTDDSLPSEGGAVPSGEETGIQDEAEEQTNTAEATGDETAASGSRTGTLISSIKTETPSVASGPGNLFKMYYGVSADAYGTVTVVGPDSRTVKTLYDDFLHKQGYYLLTWDLREADGTYAAEGRYTVKLEFRTAGGTVDTGELSFDIAGLTLSSVKGDRTEMMPGETLTFYYQIDRAAKGTIGVYNESGEEVRNIYNEFQHAAGYYKAVWNGKDSSGTPVPEGTYTVRIAFGNVKAELAVTVGRSNQLSPVLSSVKLEKGTVDLTKGETVKFYYGLSEAVAGDITVYNSTGGEVAKLYDDFSHSAGYYAALWNGKDKNGMPVSSGEYTIRLEFKGDRKELKVTVRNEAIPGQDFELSGIKVAESPLYWGETAKVYYNLTGDSIGTVTIKNEEGETVKTLYDAFAHAKGYYAVNWNLKDESGEYVPAGKYTVEFIFTSGNYRKVLLIS